MFSEPQSITINAIAKTLPRVSFGDKTGSFESVSDGIRLRITQILGKARVRRNTRLDVTKTAADPLLDGVSRQYSSSYYFSVDHPLVGVTPAEAKANAKGFLAWCAVDANLDKLLNGES